MKCRQKANARTTRLSALESIVGASGKVIQETSCLWFAYLLIFCHLKIKS
jgi:hypothetical protein